MKIERTKNAVRNVMWGTSYRLVSIIFPFAFRTVMIQFLGAEYLGVNTLFTSVLQVLNLSELGFGSAIVYSMYKAIAEEDSGLISAYLNFYKKIYLIIGTIILVVGLLLCPLIPHLIAGTYPNDINIYFVYVLFLINASFSYLFFGYSGALFNAFQRNDIESRLLLFITVLKYSLEIAGIVITKQYYLFLFVEIGSTMALNLGKFILSKRYYPQYKCSGKLDAAQKGQIKKNVVALFFHKIGGVILNSGDNIVLSAFIGVVAVATYGNYYYIMNSVESFIIVAFAGLTAGIGNSFVTETVSKNRNTFLRVLFFNGWISCVACSMMVAIYQDFIYMWVGEKFLYPNYMMYLIVAYFFVHSIRRTIIVFRDGAGMWQDNKWQPIVSATFNIFVNIMLVVSIGVPGIVISSILSMLLIDIPWESNLFCKKIEMQPIVYYFSLLKFFMCTVLSCIIIFFISIIVQLGVVYNIFVKGIIGFVIANTIIWIAYHKSESYSYYLSLVLSKIRR